MKQFIHRRPRRIKGPHWRIIHRAERNNFIAEVAFARKAISHWIGQRVFVSDSHTITKGSCPGNPSALRTANVALSVFQCFDELRR